MFLSPADRVAKVTVRGKKASVAVNRRFRVDPRIICLLTHLRLRLLWRRRRPRPSSMVAVAHIVLFPMLCIRQMVMTPTQSPLAVCQRWPPNKTANDDIRRLWFSQIVRLRSTLKDRIPTSLLVGGLRNWVIAPQRGKLVNDSVLRCDLVLTGWSAGWPNQELSNSVQIIRIRSVLVSFQMNHFLSQASNIMYSFGTPAGFAPRGGEDHWSLILIFKIFVIDLNLLGYLDP